MTGAMPAPGHAVAPTQTPAGVKPPLLFLCHRIPYPPNKGDKIRSFHLLHHLSQHFDIYLGSFVDDPQDWPWAPEVEKYCKAVCLRPLNARLATVRSLRGLLSGQALSIPYYAHAGLRKWVAQTVAAHGIRHAMVYSSAMAQFLPEGGQGFRRKVIDFVDVDSDKWQQYARQKPWPLSWVYRREARCLLALEQTLAEQFDAGLFVSCTEADLFHQLSPATAHKIGYYNNGVNCAYFDPQFDRQTPQPNPFPADSLPLVFTGAMDYWPNVEAVKWFCDHVLEGILKEEPNFLFCIVGMKPTDEVQELGKLQGVWVTGGVPDVRPYLSHALAACLPLQLARGIQNKALEAMAMTLPMLATKEALLGIVDYSGVLSTVANDANEMTIAALKILSGARQVNSAGRACVLQHYNWDTNLRKMEEFLLSNGGNQ